MYKHVINCSKCGKFVGKDGNHGITEVDNGVYECFYPLCGTCYKKEQLWMGVRDRLRVMILKCEHLVEVIDGGEGVKLSSTDKVKYRQLIENAVIVFKSSSTIEEMEEQIKLLEECLKLYSDGFGGRNVG